MSVAMLYAATAGMGLSPGRHGDDARLVSVRRQLRPQPDGRGTTTSTALTAHLIMPAERPDAFLASVAHELAERFGIAHATLQIEDGSCAECCLAPEDRPGD